ncbi:aspartate/glutamate racemase family protein [Microbacterium sp. M3]|uniref:Aspartate/glutamate racemase family protein n=1 Tax=Microbacterium arthrosphaerae TaxID=792652 RepID=A0ABU4H0Q3_9MICO|nr:MULTISPECIES: aspartate/glutamate racemase family protein [Microbacterium]MDW4572905.1 aspartate/glutamate racemase family protein [Microbacterium arthrosphaerae]MDW7606760.1 aspartate/glutamate racemase family protein [Microbacterium sp. M3]
MNGQQQVPGVIGFAPATDAVYLRTMQMPEPRTVQGLVNRLRVLYATLDTDEFFALDDEGRTQEAQPLIEEAARSLQAAGADFLVVTSNTGSLILEEAAISDLPPMLSIFDATAAAAQDAGVSRIGLLSTRRTAESRRYDEALARIGVETLIPALPLLAEIDSMIDREAIRGLQTPEALALLHQAVARFAELDAQAIILGCTDLMLFGAAAIGADLLPVIDSTVEHAHAARRLARAPKSAPSPERPHTAPPVPSDGR